MPATPLVDVDARLRLTNADEVLYADAGTTKGGVIPSTIADALIPHLAERPVTRMRWPDGIGTAAAPIVAFEQQVGRGVSDWVLRSRTVAGSATW